MSSLGLRSSGGGGSRLQRSTSGNLGGSSLPLRASAGSSLSSPTASSRFEVDVGRRRSLGSAVSKPLGPQTSLQSPTRDACGAMQHPQSQRAGNSDVQLAHEGVEPDSAGAGSALLGKGEPISEPAARQPVAHRTQLTPLSLPALTAGRKKVAQAGQQESTADAVGLLDMPAQLPGQTGADGEEQSQKRGSDAHPQSGLTGTSRRGEAEAKPARASHLGHLPPIGHKACEQLRGGAIDEPPVQLPPGGPVAEGLQGEGLQGNCDSQLPHAVASYNVYSFGLLPEHPAQHDDYDEGQQEEVYWELHPDGPPQGWWLGEQAWLAPQRRWQGSSRPVSEGLDDIEMQPTLRRGVMEKAWQTAQAQAAAAGATARALGMAQVPTTSDARGVRLSGLQDAGDRPSGGKSARLVRRTESGGMVLRRKSGIGKAVPHEEPPTTKPAPPGFKVAAFRELLCILEPVPSHLVLPGIPQTRVCMRVWRLQGVLRTGIWRVQGLSLGAVYAV
jgi:hypothetical protein